MLSARLGWAGMPIAMLTMIGLSACGGSEDASAPALATPAVQTVGPAGGVVTGVDGVTVAVPEGGIGEAVTIRVARLDGCATA